METKSTLKEAYSYLFEEELLQEMEASGVLKSFEANDTIIDIDHYIVSIPLVVKGAIKILREDDDGNSFRIRIRG